MKKFVLLTVPLWLSGCTTVPMTGQKKLLGIVPVPFTKGAPVEGADPNMALLVNQLAPFQWVALVLIVGGAAGWWLTQGKTGMFKAMVALGMGLSVFAVVLPKIAGWIGLVALLAIVGFGAHWVMTKNQTGSKTR